MKKRPILNAYEMKIFKEWIADGNAVETEKGVWLEQTTQYRVKFTYEELQNYFKKEYLTYKNGGSAKDLLSSRASKVAKKEKSLNLKAYNVPSVPYAINPLNEGLDEIFQDIVGKDELREAMSGVDFVGNTATGTDAHKLLHLVGKREGKFKDGNYYLFSTMENEWSKDKILSKEMSVAEYYKHFSLIQQRFPNWIAVVYDNFSHKQEFNLPTLYDIVNSLVVSKLLNKETNAIIIEFNTKDGAYQIGFNAKIFRSVIKSMIMAGITNITGYFRLPNNGVTILDSSLRFPNEKKRDEFFTENSFGLVMPIMLPDEETLEETRKEGLEMAEFDNLVYEFPVIRVISANEYEIEIYGQDTLTYSRGKGIKIGTKSTTKSTPKSTPKETPKATSKTTDKKTALGNKLRKGMVVRIEYKESNGSTLSYDLFYDNGDFIEYVLIINKKGEELVEAEEIITEKELNEKYTELSEFIVAEFYETKEDGGQIGGQIGGQMKLFVGGGRAIRPTLYSVYKVKDKMGRVMYLNDNELQKFINDWNEDYFTDYEDWVEFNEYEMEFVITPVFSKNEMGGDVDFVERQINDIANWENEEIASYLEIPVNEVANNREEYIEEAQNSMLVNQVDGDYAMGGIIGNEVDFMYYGEPRKGKIIEDFGDSYGVQSGSSQIAVDKADVLRTIAPKKETSFRFFDDGGGVENKIQLKNFSDLKQGDVIRRKERIGTTIFVVNKSPVQSRIYKNEYDALVTCIVSNTNFYKPLEEYYIKSVIKYGKLGNVDYLGKWNYDDKIDYSIYLPKSNKKFVDGGGVGEFPPKGELTNKDNFLLQYEKKGGKYEFFVYKPITKEVSGYNQIKHVCLNKDCPQKMTYEQFINYLYAELYLDDTKYADGGDVPNQDKMFQLPLEMVIYVPSTQDVDKVISVDKMDKRVDEVKTYLANKFGGYTSADKLGGFVDSTGNLVNEDVVQVTSFSTKEAYAKNKEELVNQLAKWGEEWGQESIGFEFEGDLMYVPQKFKNGGSLKKKSNDLGEYYEKYSNGGFVGGDIIKFKYDGKDFTRKVESVDEMGNAVVNLMKSEKATINPADIFDIKKEFTEKDVIIKKIGFNEALAEYLISVSPTFAVWLADSILENEIEERQESKEVVLKAINEKSISKNTNYLNNNFGGGIREILDWLQHPSTPKQNLRELTFNEALQKAKEWHQELTTSGGDLNFTEPKENIVIKQYAPNQFGKTYYWVFIPKNYCDIESARMGHCGRTGAGSLISLRSVFKNTNEDTISDSHVTIAYNYEEGKFYQAKGKQNKKPVEKYFPYISDLIESLASGEIQEKYELDNEEKFKQIKEYDKKIKEIDEKVSKHIRNGLGFTQNKDTYFASANNLLGYEIEDKQYADKFKRNILENITRHLDDNAYIQDFGNKYAKLQELQNNVRNNREFEGYELAKEELVEDYFNWYLENISYPYKEWKELQNDRYYTQLGMDDYNFDFNGFESEYQASNDYGWEDMTDEQILGLYELKPKLFNDFAGQYMLYKIGLIDEEPNTKVTIEKPVGYVADLLSVDRDLSDDFVEKVLTGDTDDLFSSDSWSYYDDNAGDYVDDLNKEDYDAVLDKIVEITGLDKEIVEENGAKHYLVGDDEEFDSETFEDIKRAIASALEGMEISSYQNYYFDTIKEALGELGVIKNLDDTGVEIEVDLKDLIGISAISGYMKNLDSENLEDVFFEAESNGDFSLPTLSIDDRYSGDTDGWQEYFDINNYAVGGSVKYKAPSYKKKIFGVYIFETKNKSFELEVYLFERENDTEDALEIQNDLRKELGSIIIKNVAWKNLLSGKKVMARSSKNNYVGTLRQVNTFAVGGAVYPDLSMQKAQVVNDSFRIPEFELKQAKDVLEINGLTNKKILSSNDSVDIFRSMWEKDTINAYEQAYIIFLNRGMKPIGYYHHSSGGIDGTIMDIQMISGMAVKSLAKGVIIAHNHPSGNTQPSDADKRITEQMKQALKLFNIQLLDSIILTENNSLSFADEGYL